MRVVLQRVRECAVIIDGSIHSQINSGILILLGITYDDSDIDIDWLINKIINMRIFEDSNGTMNCSILDKSYQLMVVSQFTLLASTRKGNRPSYINAAKPIISEPMYDSFVQRLKEKSSLEVGSGKFGADMKIHLINDGPVTIILDSKNKE